MDDAARYRALAARDARFDGVFYVGVTTTGIYCRPVCRARLAARDRCRFFPSAMAAEQAGFRACFRCRPELAPGKSVKSEAGLKGTVDAMPGLARLAAARIEAGALNDGSLDALARELDVSTRHLRRAVQREIGVAPVELAQSCRLALAKKLLQDSALPLIEVAHASGFGSVRRFNASFRARFGRPPSVVKRGGHGARGGTIPLKLGFRTPLAWRAMLEFLAPRAIEGVEHVDLEALTYARTVALGDARGTVVVSADQGARVVRAEVSTSLSRALMQVSARLRALFDLDADSLAIDAHLARDPALRRRVRALPGLRVPGAFDGFEIGVRAIVGQPADIEDAGRPGPPERACERRGQVTVRGAAATLGKLAAAFGEVLEPTPRPELSRTFPTAERLAATSPDALRRAGLTTARARAVHALAEAVASRRIVIERGRDPEETQRELETLRGIGPWTSRYVAMRALGAPDAFPSGDLGLVRALDTTPKALETRAARWSPWRAYAAMHLWQNPGERR